MYREGIIRDIPIGGGKPIKISFEKYPDKNSGDARPWHYLVYNGKRIEEMNLAMAELEKFAIKVSGERHEKEMKLKKLVEERLTIPS